MSIEKIIEREFAPMKGLTSDGKRFISETELRALLLEVWSVASEQTCEEIANGCRNVEVVEDAAIAAEGK